MQSAPILVFGRTGQVAQELARLARTQKIAMVFAGRETLDLAAGGDPAALIAQIKPSAVINAAAYTAVDRAEQEEAEALQLNAHAPRQMATACAAQDIGFIHYSTDYVFDGLLDRPYREDDATGPRSVYGASKLAGEQAVLAAGGRAIVLRTAWVVGAFGTNFVKTMLRLAASRDEVGVVADQIGRPTWSASVAQAGLAALDLLAKDPLSAGLYHAGGADDASWADLAAATFERAAFLGLGLARARVKPITTADYPTPAVRPANSRLDSSKFAGLADWQPMAWTKALDHILKDLATFPEGPDA
jgi:dTDP-4-dehydrorhamnose reductase